MTNLIGQSLGRYHILEQLGEGGMATVYRAYDTRLERDVAVKIIRRGAFPPDQLDRILKRFEREARSLAKLTHPNIIPVHDFGEFEGAPYLVLDYIPGGTLKEKLAGKPIPWREAVSLTVKIARGLQFAHQQKIIHRDIKPSNILLTADGEPLITDFGIAKVLETSEGQTLSTTTGVGIGTPEYMAPEQGMGHDVDARADIYSLGILLFEMVTGRRPFRADTPMAVIVKHINDPLPSPKKFAPDLPSAVEKVILKALAKKPADRYKDMAAFEFALEGLLNVPLTRKNHPTAKATIAAENTDREERTLDGLPGHHTSRRSPWMMAGVGGALLIVMAVAFYAIRGFGTASTPTPPTEAITAPLMTEEIRPSIVPPTAVEVFTVGSSWTRPADAMVMMYVPAGTFTMGSDIGDVDEKPVHQVYLSAYWMDRTEVTNGMYLLCVKAGACTAPDPTPRFTDAKVKNYPTDPQYADFPASADRDTATAYCAWAGARLPTEAEWEKAARGTDERIYPWGSELNCNEANYFGSETNKGCAGFPVKVGSYAAGLSPYGLFDMAGNFWEWVSDWYDSAYYANSPSSDPQGPSSGSRPVLRGGSFASAGYELRVSNREHASSVLGGQGFRCARSEAQSSSITPIMDTPQTVSNATAAVTLASQITDSKGVSMALVPAGSFTMGSENGYAREKPVHLVTLSNYYMDLYETTNQQYKACVDSGTCIPPLFDYSKRRTQYYENYPQYPVVFITYDMAKTYCEWRGNGTRLPTEAEWEKAARGTDGRSFPWGEGTDCARENFFNDAITRGSLFCTGDTTPVGSYKSGISPYGIFDMAGNVWEWVLDWYGENYYASLLTNALDPLGPSEGTERVMRGGSFSSDSSVRSFTRWAFNPQPDDYTFYYEYGFRCVRPAP